MTETGQLHYSVVAYNKVVLAENMATPSNLDTIARKLLAKVPAADHRKSYSHQGKLFHYMGEGGLLFLVVCDESVPHRIAFAFLEDIKGRWHNTFPLESSWKDAYELQLNDQFSRILADRMHFFTVDPRADKIKQVKTQIDEVKGVMINNVEKVLERGEQIETLVEKTEEMESRSYQFRSGSKTLKNKLWWKNVWLMVVICVIVVVILAAVAFIIAWQLGLIPGLSSLVPSMHKKKHHSSSDGSTGGGSTAGSGDSTATAATGATAATSGGATSGGSAATSGATAATAGTATSSAKRRA